MDEPVARDAFATEDTRNTLSSIRSGPAGPSPSSATGDTIRAIRHHERAIAALQDTTCCELPGNLAKKLVRRLQAELDELCTRLGTAQPNHPTVTRAD